MWKQACYLSRNNNKKLMNILYTHWTQYIREYEALDPHFPSELP